MVIETKAHKKETPERPGDMEKIAEVVSLLEDSRTKIVDPKNDWIYLNRVWGDPNRRKIFYDAYKSFVTKSLPVSQKDAEDCVFLIPEGLSSSYGILPFALKLADDCGKRVAIWKEWGNEIYATPLFFPYEEFFQRGTELIVLTDVVGNGIVIRKIHKYLDAKKFTISKFISAIQLPGKSDKLKENLSIVSDAQGSKVLFKTMLIREGNRFRKPEARPEAS